MAKIRKKKKIFKTVVASVLATAIMLNSQVVWAGYGNPDIGKDNSKDGDFQQQQSQAAGTMLVFNAKKVPPALNGVTNENNNVISQKEATARRDAANQIKKELREAFVTDTTSGYSGLTFTTTERKIMNAEVIERVMEKLVKCDADEVGAMVIEGSKTLADRVKTKAGTQKIRIREGRAPRFVIDSFDVEYRENMNYEEQEWIDAFNEYRHPDPRKTPGNEVNFETGGLNAEAFDAILNDDKGDWSDTPPVYDWDDKTKTIVNTKTVQYAKVEDGESDEYQLKDLFEWAEWFTYGYQKKMYELIKDKKYVESDEFEVSPEIQFYPGSIRDIWEAFEDIVAIGNSDFIHVTTIKNYMIDSVVIGDITSSRPKVEESFWEVYQVDENGERYNHRLITGDIHGNLNVAFDKAGTYYIKQTIPSYITYGNTYDYTWEEYTVEECSGIILDYRTGTDRAYVKYTKPERGLIDGARYVQPITEEQCNKNWIVTPDSIRMGNNLYMVE